TDPSIGQYLWSLPDTNEAINNCLLKISWSDNETISSRFSIVPSNGSSGSQKIILEENFDETPFSPNGWSIIQFNSTNTWKQGNVTENDFNEIDPTSVNSAICPWKNEDQNEWLVSPSFALSNGDAYIDFYAGYSTQWLANATLKLHISIDDGNNWTELWEAENDGNPWGWRQKNIDITSYAGYSNLKVAWQYLGNDGDNVAIDNVKITGFDETTDIYEQKEISVNYKLSQNYPNPFNPTTVISYGIPTQTDVKIIIYDLLGNEVKTLIDLEQSSGYKRIFWDSTNKYGRKVSAGIYIYQLQTDYFIATRKMVLVK
ncbi:choice-of-anchor J domain-containing protein, partial [bacterium]|nr:choice-of-anchor J domain-containing protein [bacterium]